MDQYRGIIVKALQIESRCKKFSLLRDYVRSPSSFLLHLTAYWTSVFVPFDFKILRILLPVTTLTWATPWLSRRTTPICDGVAPFRASLQMLSTTVSGVDLNQVGTDREYGIAEALIPFPLLWRRPMVAVECCCRGWRYWRLMVCDPFSRTSEFADGNSCKACVKISQDLTRLIATVLSR